VGSQDGGAPDRGLKWPGCSAFRNEGSKVCDGCPHWEKLKGGPVALHRHNPKREPAAPSAAIDKSKPNGDWPDGTVQGGTPKAGYANTLAAIRKLGIKFSYDLFRQKEFGSGHKIEMLDGELSDAAVTMLRDHIRDECGFYPGKDITRDAITAECLRNRFDPVVDYFNGLIWDRKPRLAKMLHKYLGAEDSSLNEAIGIKLMCGIVRRAKQPACKFDHEVVLEGNQGVKKSMFCEDLAVFPDLFTDAGDLGASTKRVNGSHTRQADCGVSRACWSGS
jgi:hypothetical protein